MAVVLYTASYVTFFFFNDTATTEIYTLSLHDALPIYHHDAKRPRRATVPIRRLPPAARRVRSRGVESETRDRKSTRLNSSHANISYAVFCLKKKNKKKAIKQPSDTPYRAHLVTDTSHT